MALMGRIYACHGAYQSALQGRSLGSAAYVSCLLVVWPDVNVRYPYSVSVYGSRTGHLRPYREGDRRRHGQASQNPRYTVFATNQT